MMQNAKVKSSNPGFTLIETILVVALIGIISSVGLPLYNVMSGSSDLDVAENLLVASLRRAETLSVASSGDSEWGVAIEQGAFVLFKGVNFASRDASFDEVYDISNSIQTTGLSEVVFAKFLGTPHVSGDINLTNLGGKTKKVIINEKGMVQF